MNLTNKSPVQDRLNLLQQADGHRSWHSLEDERFCVRCLKIFNGHALRIARRDAGHYEILCPTAGCDSSPLHWLYHGRGLGRARPWRSADDDGGSLPAIEDDGLAVAVLRH